MDLSATHLVSFHLRRLTMVVHLPLIPSPTQRHPRNPQVPHSITMPHLSPSSTSLILKGRLNQQLKTPSPLVNHGDETEERLSDALIAMSPLTKSRQITSCTTRTVGFWSLRRRTTGTLTRILSMRPEEESVCCSHQIRMRPRRVPNSSSTSYMYWSAKWIWSSSCPRDLGKAWAGRWRPWLSRVHPPSSFPLMKLL